MATSSNNNNNNNNLAVLTALDNARTQWYHVKAIIIAGMGFFTDAYDLFCITAVSKLLGRLYYYDPAAGQPGKLPQFVNNTVSGVALVGMFCGQLFFGWLGDKLGRKRVYGSPLSSWWFAPFALGSRSVLVGNFGIGGDYPLSATIMCEYANKKTRGAFIAAVFAMQGVGIIFAGLVSMIMAKIFPRRKSRPDIHGERDPIHAASGRLTVAARPHARRPAGGADLLLADEDAGDREVHRPHPPANAEQAAKDMTRVLNMEIEEEQDKVIEFKQSNMYPILSNEFYSRHGLHLNLTQKDIFPAMGLVNKAQDVNALEEVWETSRAMFLVALLGTFPGYWFTVAFIEKLGRYFIQLLGFLMMSIFLLIMGINYEYLRDNNKGLFALTYGLTFFFAKLWAQFDLRLSGPRNCSQLG
ncbi:unnamed protein product [Linum tenue]|uniref:Uncharacterized protein n=1 Tax=Linum tenue TaxID=586396 RepID=A0AAV0QPL7_9ROSI|nr:unnamed protein product [Linum tenue]